MSTYNGHESYEHWNASLWISNDEGLYNAALDYDMESFRLFIEECMPVTPDGVTMTNELSDYAWHDVNDEE